MRPQLECPSRDHLKNYLLGLMAEDVASSVDVHLETCPACLETVQSVHCEDTLVSAMRTPPTTAVDPQLNLDQLAQRLHLMCYKEGREEDRSTLVEGPKAAGKSATAHEFEFLSPPETDGELGRLGSYRVLKVLGAGGMGVVFEAEDLVLKRRVAIKVMRAGLGGSGTGAQRFLREAQATAALRHDHIVTIHQVGEHQGVTFLAMELLPGESLYERLNREGKLPVKEALRIGREVDAGVKLQPSICQLTCGTVTLLIRTGRRYDSERPMVVDHLLNRRERREIRPQLYSLSFSAVDFFHAKPAATEYDQV